MLRARVLTSVVLMPVFLLALFLLPELYWALFMLAVILMGIWEWAGMASFPSYGRWAYLIITATAGIWFCFASGVQAADWQGQSMFWGILGGAVFWMLLAPAWLISRYHIKSSIVLALAGWLILIPTWFALICLKSASLLALINLQGTESWLLLGLLAVVWIADSAAYFVGKRFGKRKLAPKISPGKTWEGVFGAWAGVSIYGFALCQIFQLDYWLIAGLWGLTVLSIMGDLLESLIKRQAQLKDSGTLLPGHGGMLDRIDGLTSSLPLAAFFLYFPLYYAAWLHYV